jgi:RNase P subunit RPR2
MTPPVTPTVIRPWTRCQVCAYVWHLTDPDVKPRDCPGCKTMLWATAQWRKTSIPKQRALPAGTVWLCCARCGWQWFVRSGMLPVRCSRATCSSPYWHRPRVRRFKPVAHATAA